MSARLSILGTRGIPARHGGFETFAERLALYLRPQGWDVTVYCQASEEYSVREEYWNDIRLVKIPVKGSSAWSTILFDWKSIQHALKHTEIALTLGYNTALFNASFRSNKICNIMNMDGLEWQRDKWSFYEKAWLYVNERLGCLISDHVVADHPEIARHLCTRVSEKKITTIPYGAEPVLFADENLLNPLGVQPREFALVIARPEPENSILQIVQAFSRRKRGKKLMVLGDFSPRSNKYHNHVLSAASNEVVFPGAIYDPEIVSALRYLCRLYIHGHSVGGTNPSLVEALGAGSPVLAHDNRFNRWVAGHDARYFSDMSQCAAQLDEVLESDEACLRMGDASRREFENRFTWERVLLAYRELLDGWASMAGK